jgi:formylglycine-generating enzyme required for sulfatase activity
MTTLAIGPESSRSAPAPPARKHFTNSVGMKLVRIPAGKFTMGSPASESGRRPEERQHDVEITRHFFLGAYLVTQTQYAKVAGGNPSHFCGTGLRRESVKGLITADFPVEYVSWEEAAAFCKKLSALPAEKAATRHYRLPTEAEWEYACRAGTTTPFHFGRSASSKQANFNGLSPYGGAEKGIALNRPCKVGSYKANAWGLFDMHGNVWQFCGDWYDRAYYQVSPKKDPQGPNTGTTKILRGGAFGYTGDWCRAAFRLGEGPTRRWDHVGFRVACDLGRR